MNSSGTWRLFLAAIALFAFIYFVESRPDKSKEAGIPNRIFSLQPGQVSGVEIMLSNQVLRAERTNDSWRLITPFYPAQGTPIESFVARVTGLPRLEVISASEVSAQPGKLKDFGLEPPAAILTLLQGTNRYYLHLGSRVPITDQIYAQTPGSGEVVVTDSSILKAIPATPNEWRSAMLLNLANRPFDHVQIRAGQRLLEFERDVTNEIWRISKPTPARANNDRITQVLQQLTTARVKEFVTDSPAADLERYGLQTPELELSFALETNRVTALEFGSSPTNDPANVYVRRPTTTNIVLVSRELFDALSLPYKAYHDPRLVSVDAAQVTQIRVNGTNGFAVARQTNGLWQITEPAPMAADQELMQFFITNLLTLEIVDFAKDVPTDADLKQFGLAPPRFSFALFNTRTNSAGALTNMLMTQVDFGTNKSDGALYARRSDETPVYVTPIGDISWSLPHAAWQLRDRRIFDLDPKEIAAVTVSYRGQTNRYARLATGWNADPIANAVTEEAVFRLAKLRAQMWRDRGGQSLARSGFARDGLMVTVEFSRNGVVTPIPISFGRKIIRNIYAATVLPGDNELTLFDFPGDLYQDLARAFSLPQ